MTGTEEEAAERLEEALGVEVNGDGEGERGEGGDGTLRELEAIEFPTQ